MRYSLTGTSSTPLTYEEIRTLVTTNPDVHVWRCVAPDGRSCICRCVLHLTARRLAGRALKVDPARIVARRADAVPVVVVQEASISGSARA